MPPTDASRRLTLIDQLLHLPPEGLAEVESLLVRLRNEQADRPVVRSERSGAKDEIAWPHAPPHRISKNGTFFVTTGTLHKQHFFRGAERLDCLHKELLSHAKDNGWQLEAWAAFSNHYHFVAHALEGASELGPMLKELHRKTAIHMNQLDGEEGRPIWFNFRDTELTYETSYYARLAYVHNNPVKHGLVTNARLCKWCSASWFERAATPAQVATIANLKTDTINVYDEYDPV